MTDKDPWLERWMPLITERAAGQPILDAGCGGGRDSRRLATAGHAVIGIDKEPASIDKARAQLPEGTFFCQDLRQPFPAPAGLGVVIASLSLHYFSRAETMAIVDRIREQLRPGGVFLWRVNTIDDVNFGARANYPLIDDEPHFHQAPDGRTKRFFTRAAMDEIAARGWRVLSLEEHTIDRYDKAKVVWEAVFEKA